MVIHPNTEFHVIKDVPFNNDYKHTILFSNLNNQYNYFYGKRVQSFTDFTYVRQTKVVKLPILADLIYDCNYCMFKNNNYGDKWFYAFITSIEYENDNTSIITFEIDYLQTWMFEFSLGTSFVEREHVNDDTIGANTVDEGIAFGENIPMSVDYAYFKEWKVIIIVKPPTWADVIRNDQLMYAWNQVYPQSYVKTISSQQDLEELNSWVDAKLAIGYEITAMHMIPSSFQTDGNASKQVLDLERSEDDIISRPDRFYDWLSEYSTAYVPKNNKLLCYPYNYLKVESHEGNSRDYRWEYTVDGQLYFMLYEISVNTPSCFIEPVGYGGDGKYLYTLPINQFPDMTWSENKFIQNLPLKIISGALSTASASGAIGNIVGGSQMLTPKTQVLSSKGADRIASGVNSLVDQGANVAQSLGSQLAQPTELHQSQHDSSLLLKYDKFGFTFYKMGIRKEYARIIDDYFTRFGYKVNRYKVPNLTGRRTFNYVKTIECEVNGNIPNEANEALANIFNSGITLWHTTNVGSYSNDNSIIRKE